MSRTITFIGVELVKHQESNCLSLADYTIFFKEIDQLIDIDFTKDSIFLKLYQIIQFREKLKTMLLDLMSDKSLLPNDINERSMEKWLKKNPRKLIIVLGRIVAVGGRGLMFPLIDRKILIYNDLLLILDDCIRKESTLEVKVETIPDSV